MSGKRVIVTGGAGFIGSHLVDELLFFKHEVIVIDNLSLGKRENIHPRIFDERTFFRYDIRNLQQIRPLFDGVDCVFHLAAHPRIQPSIIDPITSFENNVTGTLNVLMAAKEAGVKKLVFSGSSSVYGDQEFSPPYGEDRIPSPKNPYAQFKLDSERHCLMFNKLYNLPVVCFRYFNVYGERQSTGGAYATVVGIFLRQLERGEPLTIVGDGEQSRDFTYVQDVVRANIAAANSSSAVGEVINIGSGEDFSINEVAGMIVGKELKGVQYLPVRPGEARETLANISKAKQLLGWQPWVRLSDWLKYQINKEQPSAV